MSTEALTKIYFIKGPKGYLSYLRAGKFKFYPDIANGDSFPSESEAKNCLSKISKFGFLDEVIDCRIIVGEFIPQESFKAIDLMMKIPRWKKLYNVLIVNCTVPELLLLTSAEDRESVSKQPVYSHLKDIHNDFKNWDANPNIWSSHDRKRSQSFSMFKSLCRIAMSEKFKQTQNNPENKNT